MAEYVGHFKDVNANQLGAHAIKAALERSGVPAAEVEQVVMGNAMQTSADAMYGARHSALKAGLPIETPALTVNFGPCERTLRPFRRNGPYGTGGLVRVRASG